MAGEHEGVPSVDHAMIALQTHLAFGTTSPDAMRLILVGVQDVIAAVRAARDAEWVARIEGMRETEKPCGTADCDCQSRWNAALDSLLAGNAI